jgi:hypothetical protein
VLTIVERNTNAENLYEECLSCFEEAYVLLKAVRKDEDTNIGYDANASAAFIEEEFARFKIWKTRPYR